ncbi:MAG: hypothetical protein ABIG68_12665, partial [Acidobacteriota bacterium]
MRFALVAGPAALRPRPFSCLLARTIHEASAAAADLAALTGVLGPRPLRRSVQLRLGDEALRL